MNHITLVTATAKAAIKVTNKNRKSRSQNHVDRCWFDKDDDGIESSSVQSLYSVAADIQYAVFTLQTTRHGPILYILASQTL